MSFLNKLLKAGIQTHGSGVQIKGLAQTIGAGDAIYADAANGTTTGSGKSASSALSTLPLAYLKMTTGVNDVMSVIASTSGFSLASTLTWALNMSHMMGEGSFNRMNMRSRIGHSANFTPMFTVSGYGNSFHNIYFQHGRGSATNLVGLNLSGARNAFINCHIAGPLHTTEGDTSGYKLINIAASENYFKGCVIGTDSTAMDDGYLVYIGLGGDASQRVIFEDCIFFMNAAATPACFFIGTEAGLGEAAAIFLNCHFINTGTALDYAIDGTGLNNYIMYFDNRCSFVGCTDIVALAQEGYVYCGGINMSVNQVNTASSKLFNMLATNPDVS